MTATIWATDELIASGTYAGQATKIEPSSGLKATGIAPEERFGAQQFNWLMHYITDAIARANDSIYAQWFPHAPASTPTLVGATIPKADSVFDLLCVCGASAAIQTSPDGITWTSRTAGGAYGGDLKGAANTGASYCLVGATGGLQTSTDGATWTKRTAAAAFAGTFYGVASKVGAAAGTPDYVAVGTTGTIQSSTDDGATWASNTAGSAYASTFYSVAYDSVLDMWCAVGASGEIQTAPHGTAPLTWTRRRTSTETSGYVCARPGGGFIVAFDSGSSTSTILYSTNGTSWTTASLSTTPAAPWSICPGPDGLRVVIAGTDGYLYDAEVADLTKWSKRIVSGAPSTNVMYALASTYGATRTHSETPRFMLAAGYQTTALSLRCG